MGGKEVVLWGGLEGCSAGGGEYVDGWMVMI
jgi:hypothetical protein